MDNNRCGAEDGRLADQEDWESFKREVKHEIEKALITGETITCQILKERVGAHDINDVYDAACESGYTVQLR